MIENFKPSPIGRTARKDESSTFLEQEN